MKKKTLLIASCSVLSLGVLATSNALLDKKSLAKADDAHSAHDLDNMKYIGFSWKDPSKEGYKPYYRCPECCNVNPASSRYLEDKTTQMSVDEVKLSPVTKTSVGEVASGDQIANLDNVTLVGLDQSNTTSMGDHRVYVKDEGKVAAYFSRSANASGGFDADEVSSFSFDDDDQTYFDKEIATISFSYRYQNWGEAKKEESGVTYSSLLQVFTLDVHSTTGKSAKNYALDSALIGDGAWHTLNLSIKDIYGQDTFSHCLGLGFEFADLEGYFMISNIGYETLAERKERLGATPKLASDGKTLTYGLYPQNKIADSGLSSALTEHFASKEPESNGWYLYNGEYYAKATGKPRRSDYKFSDGTTIATGETYWFKCEPIEWKIYSSNAGTESTTYSLYSVLLLEPHRYDESSNYYWNSEIRTWLNGTFCDNAFTLDSSCLTTTTVDNDFNEKAYLLSESEWRQSPWAPSVNDRAANVTEWAKTNGAYASWNEYRLDRGYHWCRTGSSGGGAYYVDENLNLNTHDVNHDLYCVRPALTLVF